MPRTTVAEFTVESIEILSPDGAVDEELEPDLAAETLLGMYRTMRRARRLDERAIALQRRGELGTYAPGIGQEAAQVASATALDDGDWIVPAFREGAALLTRGAPIQAILTYAMGLEEGAAGGPEGRALPPSIPVGSQALHAVGVGWAYAMRGEDPVALAYFGDGATSTGDVMEALNSAGAYGAQTVFLCQNNGYAISTPRHKQSRAETLAQKAIGAGIRGVQVDGNDPLAVYVATAEALDHARRGDPVLIEALTYRRSMHTTSDDPRKYRREEEEIDWDRRDPITRFESYLRDRGHLTDDRVASIEAEIEAEIADAIERAKATAAEADAVDMFEHAYGEVPPWLERQAAAFSAGAESGGTDQ
ncbi:pyruvate dehydrogenase (acetyl-transferring) E1 component subunit alpha [Salinigranum sp. GCM10025319]|uniref:pyruvate dehydrogenase (acetyl-transferring) E1 component subunit alpha n=1 Tax=Salinigranum sp. GCM10025319 TaxID=3252687 RepID=UPI00360C8641